MKPLDLPPAERYPHGTRARYVGAKCRCEPCRKANTAYANQRAALARAARAELAPVVPGVRACPGVNGKRCPTKSRLHRGRSGGCCERCAARLVFNGPVPVDRVLAHLRKLSEKGVGYKSVADAADVGRTALQQIMTGKKTTIRADSERRILEVDAGAVADHGHVDSAATFKRIGELIEAGLTKGEIARRLGFKRAALQFRGSRVLARTAHAVEKLHREALAEARFELRGRTCPDCDDSHKPPARRALVARMLPATPAEIAEAWPCLYRGPDGQRRLASDLEALRSPTPG